MSKDTDKPKIVILTMSNSTGATGLYFCLTSTAVAAVVSVVIAVAFAAASPTYAVIVIDRHADSPRRVVKLT